MAIDAGNDVDMPRLDTTLHFLVQLLFDAGPVSGTGQGTVPLSWADLDAWQRMTGVSLPPWQLRLLRRLSGEYLSESNAATQDDAPPPWERNLTTARRGKVAGHIRNVLRG